MINREKMHELQKYNFAAYDLLLYLDTHPDDKKAFCLFKEIVSKYRKLREEYEHECGPIEPYSAANFKKFNWLDEPWPWEKEANV